MKKSMKLTILVLAISLITALTGCANVAIDAQITPDNLVTYSYTLSFAELDKENPNYEQLELFLLDIKEHWEENGVTGRIETADTTMKLTGTMQKQCESQYEAFETLYSYMTNEISPFDSVSLDYNHMEYIADYLLTANIDFTGILDEQIYETHPDIIDRDVEEFMDNLTCTATFSLPVSDGENPANIIESVSSHNIPLDNPYSIVVGNTVNQKDTDEMALYVKRDNLLKAVKISGAIAGAALLAVVALIVIGILKKKKSTSEDEVAEKSEENKEE